MDVEQNNSDNNVDTQTQTENDIQQDGSRNQSPRTPSAGSGRKAKQFDK